MYEYYIDRVDDEGCAHVMPMDSTGEEFMLSPTEYVNTNDILGVLGYGKTERFLAVNGQDISDFENVLNKIENETIKDFTISCLRIAPKYMFKIPASSTGKYHPACDLGEKGLVRHIISVANMLIYLTEPAFVRDQLSQDEIDCMISAAILHDSFKNGYENEASNYTKFEHPLIAAEVVRTLRHDINYISRERIARCIASHMGQWNTDKRNALAPTLPLPKTMCEQLVHMADYLASRRDVSMIHNNTVYALDEQTIVRQKTFSNVDKDSLDILNALLNVPDILISDELKSKFGIERTDEEIKSIWQSITSQRSASAKQSKYVTLAKELYKTIKIEKR